MKKLLTVSNGQLFAARILKTIFVVLIGVALGTAFWVASMPVAQAQDMSPTRMIESQLPAGKTSASASKQEYLGAVCAAVKKFRNAAPQIVRVAVETHSEWKKDILRTAFRCLGPDDCRLLGRVLHAAISGNGSDASELTELAIELAPNCAGAFGDAKEGGHGEEQGEGNFGNPPGNVNPPPGSIGGGGGQGNVVAVCHNGVTIFLTPQGAQDDLRRNPGDRLGPCVVTQSTNN
ncbi:MAG: hypothetical protein ACR2HH_07285 [Chthoniobacterales bacterium]